MRILNSVSSRKTRRIASGVTATLVAASAGLFLTASPASAETFDTDCKAGSVTVKIVYGTEIVGGQSFLDNIDVSFDGEKERNNNEVHLTLTSPGVSDITGSLDGQEGGGEIHSYEFEDGLGLPSGSDRC